MALEQHSLNRISRDYYNVADSAGGKITPRVRLLVADVDVDHSGEIQLVPAPELETALPGLAVLLKLRDIKTFRAADREGSRRNVVTAATVGGFAARHTYDTATDHHVHLSPRALGGIHQALDIVHSKMESTFIPISLITPGDREALYFLAQAARILGRGQ